MTANPPTEAQSAQVATDAERLDWLEKNVRRIKAYQRFEHHTLWHDHCGVSLREAIDRAMRGDVLPYRPTQKQVRE